MVNVTAPVALCVSDAVFSEDTVFVLKEEKTSWEKKNTSATKIISKNDKITIKTFFDTDFCFLTTVFKWKLYFKYFFSINWLYSMNTK